MEPAAAAGGMPTERDLFAVRESLLSAPLRNGLETLYDLFSQAPEFGSLINPSALEKDLFQSDFKSVRKLLAATLEQERTTDAQIERAVAAQGMARAAELLADRYHWVITNVPYLARGKQDEKLCTFCVQHYPTSKNDLAMVFLERCLELCTEGGTASLVLPQNWLFLTSYRKLRERLLKTETWHLLARLGPGAFETISGEVVKAILLTLTRGHPASLPIGLPGETKAPGMMCGLDVSESRTASQKAERLPVAKINGIEQSKQLKNPDARIALEESADLTLLSKYSDGVHGFGSKDSPGFFRRFWEIDKFSDDWQFLQSTVENTNIWQGCEQVVYWQNGQGILAERSRVGMAIPAGKSAWGKVGVAVSQMRTLPCALYTGEIFDKNVAVILLKNDSHLPALWSFCSSSEYNRAVRRIDQTLKVTNATLVKVPFDLDHWTRVARERYPNGLPCPYSDDPTQWIFHGHPCGSVVWDETEKRTGQGPIRLDSTVLQIAVARLLGYRWPAEQDADMELGTGQREWVRRCDDLAAYADKDGIVCIPSVRGESPAWERLLRLLSTSYGDSWNDAVLGALLSGAGSLNLDVWLRDRFFAQHCKLFRQRPFVWHVWDGRRRDGFHALVNYHKLAEGDGKGRRCLESLTYSYLGDWINRQRDSVKRGEGGADGRLVAALELQRRLVSILDGEPPFDIFVRWKTVDQQPIGWEPDINDGVRLNIRPFMAEDMPGGRRGAGILRTKPNIHWRKDRGKEPFRGKESVPWFWNCPGDGTCTERTDFKGRSDFDGNRWNDLHYTNAAKTTARARRVAEAAIP